MKTLVLVSPILLLLLMAVPAANAQVLDAIYDSVDSIDKEAEPSNRSGTTLQGSIKKSEKSKNKKTEDTKYDRAQSLTLSTGDSIIQLRTPDLAEREIAIEWDTWHKRFQRDVYNKFSALLWGDDAVSLGGLIIKLGNLPVRNFPEGTRASFECDIYNTRDIRNLRITESTGNAEYDELILRSVEALNRKKSLKFPKESRRVQTTEGLTIWIDKKHSGFHFKPTGDFEKVTVPATLEALK
ncbi:MAG: hypothetical protein K2X29_01885 [Candidatus Obscuribacterales bacterium]|nr:hypothetical protein [Candidatus Obscuribacterales bacterium]